MKSKSDTFDRFLGLNSTQISPKVSLEHRFGNSGAKLQSSTVILRFNFCTKLKISASIAPPSQSPETLQASVRTTVLLSTFTTKQTVSLQLDTDRPERF